MHKSMNDNNKISLTLSHSQVVALALFALGGDQRRVDTEDIAVKAHELAPGRFAWRKYPDQINLELVRVFLSDAKKPDSRALVVGSGRTGWSLTARGVKWAASMKKHGAATHFDRDHALSRVGSVDANRRKQERERLTRTTAWAGWNTSQTAPNEVEAREVFRIDSYSDTSLQQAKLARLRGLFAEDVALSRFLEAAAAALNLE